MSSSSQGLNFISARRLVALFSHQSTLNQDAFSERSNLLMFYVGISPHNLLFFLLSVSVPCACDCALCRVVSVLISVTLMTEHVCALAQDASEKCAQEESSSRQTGQFCSGYPSF